MSPAERRRRRRRRLRPSARVVVAAVVALIVVLVVAGGVLRTGSQSRPYWRALDRSYALSARPLVGASNRLDAQLRAIVSRMSGDTRTAVQATLDTLVRSADQIAEEASTLASPEPFGGAGSDIALAMNDRAVALRELRAAVDGLLGMAPLPAAGANSRVPAPPRHLTVAEAADDFTKVGSLLGEADRAYETGRHLLRGAPGAVALPSSVWTGRTEAWTSGGMEALAASPTLAAVHDIVLAKDAISLTPAPVPPPSGSTATPIVPPTSSLTVSAVVANKGNVTERGIAVTAALAAAGHQPTTRRAKGVTLAPRASMSVTLGRLRVVPGSSYTLTVTVDPPQPDAPGAQTTATFAFSVAPPSPPTVLQVTPLKGRARGGTRVTILGNGFQWVSAVKFGTLAVRFKVISATQITVVAPPGKGTVTVSVVNSGGTSLTNGSTRYTYRRR